MGAMKNLALLCFIIFAVALPVFEAEAKSRVDILPRKIVLDDRARSADITIMNLGESTGTIRLSLLSYRQDEKGIYQILETPLNPAFDPETAVRYSPKQFTLPPGGRQKIRLSIQRPADLPDGEYRFHVKAISYETKEALEGKPVPSRGKTLAVDMNLAVAIPVIVRKGVLTTGAKLENIRLLGPSESEYNKPALQFDIIRTGTAGVLGTAQAFWQPAGGGEPVKIGIVSNVNVFSEVPKRTMIMPLTNGVPSGSGSIRLVYTNDFGDKGVLDEVVLQQ
jgi:P pilus assembly chaperone PapD